MDRATGTGETGPHGGAAGNVICLASVRARRGHPALAQIEGYWDGLRDGRPVPARADVDPRGISRVLDRALVLERVAPGLARFRVAGGHLRALLDMELKGMPISALFGAESRPTLSAALESVFDTPALVRLGLSAEQGVGRAPLDGEMLLLPLADEEGRITRALGALSMAGDIGRTPRKLTIRTRSERPVAPDPAAPAGLLPENAPA